MIEGIGNDLKMSIDDLIYEIKTLKKEVKEIKSKLNKEKIFYKKNSNVKN